MMQPLIHVAGEEGACRSPFAASWLSASGDRFGHVSVEIGSCQRRSVARRRFVAVGSVVEGGNMEQTAPTWIRASICAASAVLAVICLSGAAGSALAGSAVAHATPSARIGMNYFDGWSDTVANFHFNGLVRPGANGMFAGREPLSGWRDDSPSAMNAALEWAQADAIDFFEFDWFYPPPDPTLNTALTNYRALSDHHGVGYSLLY